MAVVPTGHPLPFGACRGYRGGAPNSCAAALFPQTSLRMRSIEDEDSPKGYRSPKPATPSGGAGRKALFAGNGGQLWVFRQTDSAFRSFSCGRRFFLILFFFSFPRSDLPRGRTLLSIPAHRPGRSCPASGGRRCEAPDGSCPPADGPCRCRSWFPQ